MELLLLITSSAEMVNSFKSSLADEYIIMTADSLKKGLVLLQEEHIVSVAIDVTISDMIDEDMGRLRSCREATRLIGIVPFSISEDEKDKYNTGFDDIIYTPLSHSGIRATLRRVKERHSIYDEVGGMRYPDPEIRSQYQLQADTVYLSFRHLEKAIELSKTFTLNNFDLDRMLNMFLDTLMDTTAVGRASILLSDQKDGIYRIRCSRGLSPDFVSRLYLSSGSSIVLWLSASGRILKRNSADHESAEQQTILSSALREMKMLHSAVTIPVINEGKLTGILNLDNKITGIPFNNPELERIFILATYLGKAIRDIYHYQSICEQKEYIQKILEQMESEKREVVSEKKTDEDSLIFNELVGRMSHELRNPLVSIRTFTQLMKERYNDPEFKDFFYTTVTGEVEKLNSLVEKLIAFTHPIEYKFNLVDIGKVLDDSILAVTRNVKQSEFRILRNYKRDTIILRADKVQLGKAFSHLIQNSLSAMTSGGTLTIDVEQTPEDETCSVSIKDTGKGIPQEDIDRIFDPFYTTPEKGVGLGLPLSRKIIEGHGGKITVSSVLNQGTTLTVILPSNLQDAKQED
ncbi:MAG: GAF domain-containing protein [Nitrospirae bacterium]|nr:GAF domain-containing protein [Nitrospirota bacterium]